MSTTSLTWLQNVPQAPPRETVDFNPPSRNNPIGYSTPTGMKSAGDGVSNTLSENTMFSAKMGADTMLTQFKAAVAKPNSPEFEAASAEYQELRKIGASRNIERDGFVGSFYNAWQMAAPAALSYVTGKIGSMVGRPVGAGLGLAMGAAMPTIGEEPLMTGAGATAGAATGGLVGFYAPWIAMGIGDMRLRAREEGYEDEEALKMALIFGPLHGIAEGMQQQVIVGAWKGMFKEAPMMAFERFGPTMLKFLGTTGASYGIELSEEFTQGTLMKGFDLALKMRNRPDTVGPLGQEAREIAQAGWSDMMDSMGPLAWMMAIPVAKGGYMTANRAVMEEGKRANIVHGLRQTDVFKAQYGLSNKEANQVVDEMGRVMGLNNNSLASFPLHERMAFMKRVRNEAIVKARSLTMNKIQKLIPGSTVAPVKGGGYVITTEKGDKVHMTVNSDVKVDPKRAEEMFPGVPLEDLRLGGVTRVEDSTVMLEDGTRVKVMATVDLPDKADKFSVLHEMGHVWDSNFATYAELKEKDAIIKRTREEQPEETARLENSGMTKEQVDREIFARSMEAALAQRDAKVKGDSYTQKAWNWAAKLDQTLNEGLITEDIADVLLNGGVRNQQEAKRVPGEIESTTMKAMEEGLPGQVYDRGAEMQLTPEEEYQEHLDFMRSEEGLAMQDDFDALVENVPRIGENYTYPAADEKRKGQRTSDYYTQSGKGAISQEDYDERVALEEQRDAESMTREQQDDLDALHENVARTRPRGWPGGEMQLTSGFITEEGSVWGSSEEYGAHDSILNVHGVGTADQRTKFFRRNPIRFSNFGGKLSFELSGVAPQKQRNALINHILRSGRTAILSDKKAPLIGAGTPTLFIDPALMSKEQIVSEVNSFAKNVGKNRVKAELQLTPEHIQETIDELTMKLYEIDKENNALKKGSADRHLKKKWFLQNKKKAQDIKDQLETARKHLFTARYFEEMDTSPEQQFEEGMDAYEQMMEGDYEMQLTKMDPQAFNEVIKDYTQSDFNNNYVNDLGTTWTPQPSINKKGKDAWGRLKVGLSFDFAGKNVVVVNKGPMTLYMADTKTKEIHRFDFEFPNRPSLIRTRSQWGQRLLNTMTDKPLWKQPKAGEMQLTPEEASELEEAKGIIEDTEWTRIGDTVRVDFGGRLFSGDRGAQNAEVLKIERLQYNEPAFEAVEGPVDFLKPEIDATEAELSGETDTFAVTMKLSTGETRTMTVDVDGNSIKDPGAKITDFEALDYDDREMYTWALEIVKANKEAPNPPAGKGINISSYEKGLGGQLTNFAKMPLFFEAKNYPSAEAAYQDQKGSDLSDRAVKKLMIDIMSAKLAQYPSLGDAITKAGGIPFLKASTHNLIKGGKNIKQDRWTGDINNSLFMQSLVEAYKSFLYQTTGTRHDVAEDGGINLPDPYANKVQPVKSNIIQEGQTEAEGVDDVQKQSYDPTRPGTNPRGAGAIVGLLNELDRAVAVQDVDSLLDTALPQGEVEPLRPLPPIEGEMEGTVYPASTELRDIRDPNIRTDIPLNVEIEDLVGLEDNKDITFWFGNMTKEGKAALEDAEKNGTTFVHIPQKTLPLDAVRIMRRMLDRLSTPSEAYTTEKGNQSRRSRGIRIYVGEKQNSPRTQQILSAALNPDVVVPTENLMPDQKFVWGVSPNAVKYGTEPQMKETDDGRWEIPDVQDIVDETGDVTPEVDFAGRPSFLRGKEKSLAVILLPRVARLVRGIGAAFLSKHMAFKLAQRKHQVYRSAISTYIHDARQLARQAREGQIDKKSYNQLRQRLKSDTAIWLEARLKIIDQAAYNWQWDETDVMGLNDRGRAVNLMKGQVAVEQPPRTNINFLLGDKGQAYKDIMFKLDRLLYAEYGAEWPKVVASLMGKFGAKAKNVPFMKVSPKSAQGEDIVKYKDAGGNWIYPQDKTYEVAMFTESTDPDVLKFQAMINEAIKATYHAETKNIERFYLNTPLHPAQYKNQPKVGEKPAKVVMPLTSQQNFEPRVQQEIVGKRISKIVGPLHAEIRKEKAKTHKSYRKELIKNPRMKAGLKSENASDMLSIEQAVALITERVFMNLDMENRSQDVASRDTGSGNFLNDKKYGWNYDWQSQSWRKLDQGKADHTDQIPYREWNHSTDADWNAYLDFRVNELIEQQVEKYVQSGGTMIDEVSFAGNYVHESRLTKNGQLYADQVDHTESSDEANPDTLRDQSTPEMQLTTDYQKIKLRQASDKVNNAQAGLQEFLQVFADKYGVKPKGVFMGAEMDKLLDEYYGNKNLLEQHLLKSLKKRQAWLVKEFGLKGFKAWPFTIHPTWNPANREKNIDIGGNMYSMKDIGTAMTLFVDLQQYPEAVPSFYDKLTKEQQGLVELSQSLPQRVQDWITEQQKDVKALGVKLSTGKNPVLKKDTVLDHYVMHMWKSGLRGEVHPSEVAFSLFTGRTMEREFNEGGILEGWSYGKELAMTDYAGTLFTASRHLSSALENQVMMKAGADAGLFVDKKKFDSMSLEEKAKFEKIQHSSFRMWKKSGKSTGHRIKVKMPNGGKSWGTVVSYQMRPKAGTAVIDEETGEIIQDEQSFDQEWTVRVKLGTNQVIEVPILDSRPDLKGKEFFVDRMGNIYTSEALYAPEPMAKHWNNVLAASKLRQIKGMDKVLLFNSIAKQGVLMMSLFHQWAFWRSAGLGGAHGMDSFNIAKLQRLGAAAVEEFGPELESLVYAGMTMGKVLDWDPRLGDKAGAFTKFLEQHKHTKDWAPKKWEQLMAIRNQYESYLFGTVGANLKAQTGLVELRHAKERLRKKAEYNAANSDTQREMEMQLTRDVAKLMNRDFGGMDYERMGISPTMLDASRLALLGPDWTISNVMSMWGAIQRGDEGYIHRAFWTRIAAKTAAITLAWNLMMMPFGDDEFEKAYAAGNLRWMGMNLTPIYHLLGGDPNAGMYFQLAGHFLDPLKFIDHPVKSAKYKSSVVGRIVTDAFTGKDFANRRYTTLGELLTSGKTVSWKSSAKDGPISNTQVVSFLLNKKAGIAPIGIQKIGGWITGNNDGFEMITQLAGMSTQKRYPRQF